VFVNLVRDESIIACFRWDGATLQQDGDMIAAGGALDCRDKPMVVVPAVRGLHTSYLVVVGYQNYELLVLSLRDDSLVHTYDLREGWEDDAELAYVPEKGRVHGLAADAAATTLAVVFDFCVRLLPWPLRGMPALT
jgi:hypothetical protein